MGAAAPLVVGEGFPREPPRNRFPWACLCLLSPRRESRPPEATGQETKSQRQKANPQRPGGLPAAAGTGGPLRRGRKTGTGREIFRSCESDLLSQRGERRQRRARGTSSEHTSLSPFPQNRNTAKTPYRSVVPPLQIETVRFDLRRTFRRNLPAATKGSCAVFRRMRTRLRPMGSPAGVTGGRGTRVWTGAADCHSRCAHRLRNDGGRGAFPRRLGRGRGFCPLRRGRPLSQPPAVAAS